MRRSIAIVFILLQVAIQQSFSDQGDPLQHSGGANSALSLRLLHSGERPTLGSNEITTSSSIAIHASRNEVVHAIAQISGQGCASLTLSGAQGLSLHFYEIDTVQTKYASYKNAPLGEHLDPLIPLNNREICLKGNNNIGYLWIDILIPRSHPSGKQILELSINSGEIAKIQLEVWPMVLADEPAIPFYTDFATYGNLLGHYGKWHDGEEVLALSYAKMLAAHRMIPISSLIQMPSVIGEGQDLKLDLENKAVPQQGFKEVSLSWRPSWAKIGIPTVPLDKLGSDFESKYLGALGNGINEFSESEQERLMVYLWDEPDKEKYPEVKLLASKMKKAAPDVQVMVTTNYDPILEPVVDIFAPVMDFYEHPTFPAPEKYRELQSKGKEVWWYVSCMSHGCTNDNDAGTPDLVVERVPSYVRVLGWLSHWYGLDAFLYYFVNYAYEFYPSGRDPWKDIWHFTGNGDGTLLYPGRAGERAFVRHQPVPSVRLKLLRQSSFDAQYLQMAKSENISWIDEELRVLLKNTREWDRNYQRYDELRIRIGNELASVVRN